MMDVDTTKSCTKLKSVHQIYRRTTTA